MASTTRKRQLPIASGADAAHAPSVERGRAIARALTRWYDEHRRTLPWREHIEPYPTWVSEIMLQQTQVAAVIPYFERWMKRFPTVRKLAAARLDDVLSAWQGLGYYSRARNLHRAARSIVAEHRAQIPSDPAQLRRLPGIGRYTAGAIASIAFDRPEPAVDGNVERVVTRLQALRGDPKSATTSKRIWHLASEWVHCQSPRRFNQALMELGALVCIPEKPRCFACPLLPHCLANRHALTAQLPESRPRPKSHSRRVVVLVSRSDRAVLVLRQPESARHWATLFTLPFAEHDADEPAARAARRLLEALDPGATILHRTPIAHFVYPITRFRFEARVFEVTRIRLIRVNKLGGRYATPEQIAELALPAPHRRVLRQL